MGRIVDENYEPKYNDAIIDESIDQNSCKYWDMETHYCTLYRPASIEKEFSAKGFANEMQRISRTFSNDRELAHIHADALMCKILRELGYNEGVDIFIQMGKWYS